MVPSRIGIIVMGFNAKGNIDRKQMLLSNQPKNNGLQKKKDSKERSCERNQLSCYHTSSMILSSKECLGESVKAYLLFSVLYFIIKCLMSQCLLSLQLCNK